MEESRTTGFQRLLPGASWNSNSQEDVIAGIRVGAELKAALRVGHELEASVGVETAQSETKTKTEVLKTKTKTQGLKTKTKTQALKMFGEKKLKKRSEKKKTEINMFEQGSHTKSNSMAQ